MIFECHGHIILDGISYTEAIARHRYGVDEAFIRKNLGICRDHGITFYRDGGDRHGVSVFAKKVAGEYGIDYRTPAYIIHKKGHYGGMFGKMFESLSEYRTLVTEARRLGADFIKTTASGMLDFKGNGDVTGPAMALEELSEMVNIAHGEGFSVMVHANGADNIKRVSESGADSIEHGFYMDNDALNVIVQTGAVWIPTCVTVSNLIGSGRYDDNVLKTIIMKHIGAIKNASGIGVLIACGSDAGAVGVLQGKGTIDELTFLGSLGINIMNGNRKIEEVFRIRC